MRYASDLNDEQWAVIEVLTERSDPRGAERQHSMRQIINGILYVNKTGCQWRMFPREFPPWQTVYDHYRRFHQRGLWEKMMLNLNQKVREKRGARPRPVISSLTLKVSKPTPRAKREASTGARRSKGAAAKSQ